MAVADGRLRAPRRGVHGLARAGAVERDGVAALGIPRRDADGDAGRPGGAQGFRPPGVAGAELFEAAVRRHQGGDRGERAGAGLRSHRARLPSRRKRHAGPGRGDPAGRHFRRNHRRRAQSAAAARVAGPRAADLDRLAEMLAAPNARWCWWAARSLPMRCTTRRLRRSAPARRGMDAAGQPHPSPAATVRLAGIRTTAATWASACRRS